MYRTRKYRIRKNSKWRITASTWGKLVWIIFIIISLSWFISYSLPKIDFTNLSEFSKRFELSPALFSIPFFIVWVLWYKKEAKIDKVKNFKKNGRWNIKKVKITSIEQYESKSDDNSKWFSWYYAEAKEWDMTYCSDAYEEWHIWWTPISKIKELYKSYWYEYNENETHKQDVLREYDKRIAEKEFEVENGWFLKKLITKWWLVQMKWQKEIIEKEYEPQYREVNWKRITVWDTVDIYTDPNDEKNYWMDIDFLFDK